jgi:alkanesulfonate monooxygenase SsuD/methylene tetrahydromethanopterin reductase-like flavin-dependent oxidoreductase (luciferase family)
MFTLRFDMRAPEIGASRAELYDAAIAMCAWAETRGGVAALLSEHHAADDHHLPSPLILASAIAARTEKLPIMLAAIVLPLYDTVRLAEDMSLLDIISKKRVTYVLVIGHRAEEYQQFGLDYRTRGQAANEKLALLLELLKGKPVAVGQRQVHVTPPPLKAGGPVIMIGGGTAAAVRRAARHGLGFVAQGNPPGLAELYVAECQAHGHEPGIARFTNPDAPTGVFVADDVDAAWDELGPFILHDALAAAAYRHGQDGVASITRARTVDELRSSPGPYRIYSVDEATALIRSGQPLPLHPLCGGLQPDRAWTYLENAARAAAAAG